MAPDVHRPLVTVAEVILVVMTRAVLEHVPSGHFHANCAWLACAVLAHNLGWTTQLAEQSAVTHCTRRVRLIAMAAVIVNHAGRILLRFPARSPWANDFQTALDKVRALPAPSR